MRRAPHARQLRMVLFGSMTCEGVFVRFGVCGRSPMRSDLRGTTPWFGSADVSPEPQPKPFA